MGVYVVKSGQTIYNIALDIYGSIEGVTDLIVNNELLSFDSDLKVGDKLLFSDDYFFKKDIVDFFVANKIQPSTGQLNVYFKKSVLDRVMDFVVSNKVRQGAFSVSGNGLLEVDWGDNSDIQVVCLRSDIQTINHIYDNNVVENRNVRFYSNANLDVLELDGINPIGLFLLKEWSINSFILKNCNVAIDGLALLNNVNSITLDKVVVGDLKPILSLKTLVDLNISSANYSQDVLDDFLEGVVVDCESRTACNVQMGIPPSERGVNAINVILGINSSWVFTVKGDL